MNNAKQLADALRALVPLVPFDGNHDDEVRKGPQLKAARAALAEYDRKPQTNDEILMELATPCDADEAARMLQHPADTFLAYCVSRQFNAYNDQDAEFWRRLQGSVRKAREM